MHSNARQPSFLAIPSHCHEQFNRISIRSRPSIQGGHARAPLTKEDNDGTEAYKAWQFVASPADAVCAQLFTSPAGSAMRAGFQGPR